MDAKQCMIVDLERRGDKRMFITEQVASISEIRVDFGRYSSYLLLVCSITTIRGCFT